MDTHKVSDPVLATPLDTPPLTFLTSTIQVLWQTDTFRKSFRDVKKHTNCMYNGCSFCALKSIYTNFQHHKYTGLPPNIVLRAASILQSGCQSSFNSAAAALFTILSSLDKCLFPPIVEDLFGSRIRETTTCECGYSNNPNAETKLYLSFSMKRFLSLFKSAQPPERQADSIHFSRLVHQALLSSHNIYCPNHSNCSRTITPTLEVLTSPPLLAVSVEWGVGEDESSKDLGLFLDLMSTSLSSDELVMADLLEDRRLYSLCAMVCLMGGREVCFTFHSARQLWVRTDSESVKLADGTFSQLLFYMRLNAYFPTLLLYSDPHALAPPAQAPVAVTLSPPSNSSSDGPQQLSHVWEEELQNTSLWEEGNSNFLHPPQPSQNPSLTDDSSYGYLDFGVGSKEPHGGLIDLSGDISLSPLSDSFTNIEVFVHSPSHTRHESLNRPDLLPPSPDPSWRSFPPPELREHTQRRSSQKHVPSIPTPFALLWQLQVFRRSLQSVRGHVCTLKTCVFCVYQLVLERFDYKDIPVVPPELLRRAMALCFEREKGYNLGLSFDDVPKAFEELLARVHYSLTGTQDLIACRAPHCVTHQKFAASFTLSGECTCGHQLDPSPSMDLVYAVSAQSLIEETRRGLSHGEAARKGFGHILRDIGSVQDTQPCPNPACKLPLRIQRSLENKPDIFTISLNWDGLPLTTQHLDDVINSIGVSLRLTDVFPLSQPLLRFRPFYLTAIVARHDPRYAFFFHHSSLHAWYCMDDVKTSTLGDKWPGVLSALHSLPYQAILLVYTDPFFTPLETGSALTECVLSPGAEGEKIRRESLFPSNSDTSKINRNRHGSPESMYSSDAELFQWRAGEKLSPNSEDVKPEILSTALPDSEGDEEMGTFRVNEGADGGEKTLFDIISHSPENSKAGDPPVPTHPSLWVLRQLDVFRKGLSGIREHRCDGALCLLCALIQAQESKEFSFPPEIFRPLTSLRKEGDKLPTVPVSDTYQHLLARLHNSLCREGHEMSLDLPTSSSTLLCESEACVTHQRLTSHLEVREKGGATSQVRRMVLDVPALELIQKIRDLNTSTPSRFAGSIRVMRLFAQAARSLLEQSGVKNRIISLLNSPDVIGFSLRWPEDPDRDEVADFYERISTAIQPQHLFHHTLDPLISRRMYYLLGIVTESHSSYETFLYSQEFSSWTHYSGRTHSVTVMGPQLSLVWHSCKASTITHTPVFLLYSNPAASPLSIPLAPQCPNGYLTITPRQSRSNEDYVVVPNELTLTDHFSVQHTVDEALSFLDATLRHEEMLLSPSPPPPIAHELERSESDLSLISDNHVQASSQSQFTSPLSDCPFNSSIFTPQLSKFTEEIHSPSLNLSPQSIQHINEMECAERLSVVCFTLLQMNHFRLSLLQTHDQVIEDTPLLSLKQIFHIVIAVPHLIPSKFIPVSCQHLGLLSQLNGTSSAEFYIDLISQLFSRFPVNPFVNYLKECLQLKVQHKEGILYTQIVLPVSANRLVADLRSVLSDNKRSAPFPKLFSSLIRRLLTNDETSLSLMNSPDVIPIHLHWDPDVINSPDTEFIVQHLSPALLMKDLFPLVANKFISNRVLYLYGLIVSVNQVQIVIYYTTDIQSWIIYDGNHFEKIGLVWQDVRYFLESNYCRPDLLFYLNPTPNILDPSSLQRGLPEISHTKSNPGLNAVAEQILTELFPKDDPTQDQHSLRLVQDVVRPTELQQMARSPIKILIPNSNEASVDDVHLTVNAGSLEGLDIISIGSNYESSLRRRHPNRNGLVQEHKIPAPSPPPLPPSRASSDTSTFRKEARASYLPFFTSLVALWSIDLFRESLLRLEMQLRTPDSLPLVSRLKQMLSASTHATSLTPPLDLFQGLSSRLLNSPQFTGSGTEVFDTILTLLRDELRKSVTFEGPDPIEKSRLIQNIFSLTLQQSGKCRCGAIYEPIEFKLNLLHLNLALYLPHAKKTCNKYGNINNVPKLAHRAVRDTLLLMNKLDCKSQTCTRTYLATSLLVTAPRVLCLALDYGEKGTDIMSLLSALPTSLQVGMLFKEIGPLARASTLLYLTGLMAELSQERTLQLYYHTGLQTWVSVDGMGYKDLGPWVRVLEEIDALNAKPMTLFYTSPLDFSHQYQDQALLCPVTSIKRAMSVPEPSDPPTPQQVRILTSSSADPTSPDRPRPDPQYVPIQDINIKKRQNGRQTSRHRHNPQHSISSSEDTGGREDRDRERPPLPMRVSHSKESLEGIEVSRPGVANSSHYTSVSELSTLAGLSSGKSSVKNSAPRDSKTAPLKATQENGGKPKSKHKKATSITLLNKLNPKTYFKKKDKVRIPQVVQTTREHPPSDLENTSPRLSELVDTPNLKHSQFSKPDENYNDHLDQLFSSNAMPENIRSPDSKIQQRQLAPSFLTPKTFTAENMGRYDQVVQQIKGTSPPKQEEMPQPRPRNAAPVTRPRDALVPRIQRDPFETSIAAHLLLQMINFSPYYHSVLNFCRLRIKKKHQIIQALDALFKRASSHSVNQLDIIEYLNTCMPSMLGSSDFDTGHRLFHQLHWSFQPHSDAFKERYSLQVRDKGHSGSVKEMYFIVTGVSQWLNTFEKSLQLNTPVTHNHKVLREGLRKIFPSVCQHICNCPDQFYVAVDYDREIEAVSSWRIWNCIPTQLTLRDLAPSMETKHSLHKPFYLTGVVTRSETGALASYCYVESRGLWCYYSSTAASHSSMQRWDELLAQVTAHSIYPMALLYTSIHAQPLFPPHPSTSRQPPNLTPHTAAAAPVHDTSDSLASSLDRVRYHTLTPHPSVPPVPPLDIKHNLTAQLLSTLLLTPGFSSSFSLPTPLTPLLSEVRNLINSSLRSFSSRQNHISVFVERNLTPDITNSEDNPSTLYNQLISKLAEGDPSLSTKLCLSVADRNGEELVSSVSLSLSAYMSQVTNIPRFSKLNPSHCRIALKSVSSVKKKQINNNSRIICICCSQERVNRDIISHLPPQLQLSYLGSVSPKKHLQQLCYYLTGLLLSSDEDGSYTAAVYLCPREKWLLFTPGSLSGGEEFSWLQLCDRVKSSQFSPLFCFYSSSSIMGHYSAFIADPSIPPLPSSLTPDLPPSPLTSDPLTQPFILQTTNRQSDLLELRIGQLHTDYLGPTTSLTDTNPPSEMFQELFSLDSASSPIITFPPPPSDTSSPPSILLITPDFHTYAPLPPQIATIDLAPPQHRTGREVTPTLLVSAITMLWHLSFFRHAVLLSPGHTCLGYSCPMCALKSLFALHYYSRSYALPYDAISLAHTHAFTHTDRCRSIGQLVPAIARMTDDTLQTGHYRSLVNFTMEHEQGSLNAFSVPINTLNENITGLARTHRFRSETHPLIFSKALAKTLQANLNLRSIPNVLILDFRGDTLLTSQGTLGTHIRLSDLVPMRMSCLSPHYYLSSLLAADPAGKCVTFSYHVELRHWVAYDGHVANQFASIHQLTQHLMTQRFSLISSLYLNPATPRPSPMVLPQETTRSLNASGDSATIHRMQQAQAESAENTSSLYPPLPPGIGFENLLEDYERRKQAVGTPEPNSVPTSRSQEPMLVADLSRPPPLVSQPNSLYPPNLAPVPPVDPNPPNLAPVPPVDPYPSNLAPVLPVDPYPPTNLSHPLFAPPIILPPPIAPSDPNLHPSQYYHPNLTRAPSVEAPYPSTNLTRPLFTPPINLPYPPRPPQSGSSTPPKFSFSTRLQPERSLSVQAMGLLAAKLTETGVWKQLFERIPCIGESYEVNAFEQRQRKTAFNPGKAVLERIQNYHVPMEVLMDTFTQLQFQDGLSILTDPSSYSSSSPPPTESLPAPLPEAPPSDSSSSSEEDYDPDPSSVNLDHPLDPTPPPVPPHTLSYPSEDREMTPGEQLDEESELLSRRHSEEEASLLRDYQDKMEEQEARQQREVDILRSRQLQSIVEFRNELSSIDNGETEVPRRQDAPQYVPPPQLVQEGPMGIPAFPASFPPTKADMFYTQARDLYRESHNVSDFSVAFSLCVQAQNKLDLALIEPDVRLDPVKKQAFSQLRQICHQQAVKLHRRSVLRILDPNHQFKSPPKKQSHCKSKRVKFDPTMEPPQEEATPPPPHPPPAPQVPETDPPPSYTRPILRPPPLTPSLYQSIPRPPPIGRAMKEDDKENQKPEHKMTYPPSRGVKPTQPQEPADTPSDSRNSTPSTFSTLSTLSDDLTSTSSSRASSRSHRQAPPRQYPPSKPFFNEDHYTLLDQFIKCKREDTPLELDHSELSRKLLDSKIHSRSLSVSTTSTNTSPTPVPVPAPPPKRDYFKISSSEDGRSDGMVARISTQGSPLVAEKCSVCRNSKFFTIKGMCPECYTRHVRSTDLMIRTGVDPTNI